MSDFSSFLLKTVFACMACDGDIDSRELALIKQMVEEGALFDMADIEKNLNQLLNALNTQGMHFFRAYFDELESSRYEKAQELDLIRAAIRTIEADGKVEYSEVKFFKVIRSKLRVSNADAIASLGHEIADIEDYLQQDIISASYIAKLTSDYFSDYSVPSFAPIQLGLLGTEDD